MSLYDIDFPQDKYREIEKTLNATESSLRSKGSHAGADRFQKQSQRYVAIIRELRREKSTHEEVYKFTTKQGGRLDKEKIHWFSHGELNFRSR